MRKKVSSPERILALTAGGILAFLFVWFQWRLLFLAFAGLLLSILLHSVAAWVARRARLRPVLAYLLTVIGMAGLGVLVALLLGPRVITQISQVGALLPQALHNAKVYLAQRPWGSPLLSLLHNAMMGSGGNITVAAKDVVEAAVDLVIVAVIGLFGALSPQGYREGLLALVPAEHRGRARKLSIAAGETLHSWLLGQLIPMAVLGLGSMIGLWALGVPLAFTLGLITGIMIFMPYIGSIGSGLLAILFALQRGEQTAMYVFLLYCAFHLLEGYLLTPLVQKRVVRLPPILTILFQFCFWSFGGVLGVAVAAPCAAVALVLVKTLYLNAPVDNQATASEMARVIAEK